MREIHTSLLVNAPVNHVWNVLTNFREYPRWNPFIKEIKGDPKPGDKIEVRIQPASGKPMVFKPVVLKNEKEREFRWKGIFLIPGLFNGEHYFKLEALPDGTTRFIHGEIFTGILPPLLGGMLRETEQGFNAMNQALKQQCEAK